MPDWEKRVRERIGPRMLTRESVENIIAESAHFEDGYQNDLSRGLDESEASKRVRSGIQWIELAREIRRTTLKEESMNNRTKSLWLPMAVNWSFNLVGELIVDFHKRYAAIRQGAFCGVEGMSSDSETLAG